MSSNQVDRSVNGRVEYPRKLQLFLVALTGLYLIVTGVIALILPAGERLTGFLSLGALFGVIWLPTLLEAFYTRIDWDMETVWTRSPWLGHRTIPRADIVASDFSIWLQWYRVYTRGYGTIRVHAYMIGIKQFLAELPCSTPRYPPPLIFKAAANRPPRSGM